jgi:hypothetical protein
MARLRAEARARKCAVIGLTGVLENVGSSKCHVIGREIDHILFTEEEEQRPRAFNLMIRP